MKNNEYNSFNEFNQTKEYIKYEAVQTNMNSRESYSSNGESLKTEEYSYNQNSNKINSKKTDGGIVKKLIQKVTESSVSLSSGIAATVTAAVSSVVIFSTLYIHSPNIELIDLNAGYDYVTYNLYIDGMDENIDYYAVVSNNFETYRYELIEGENQNTIYNLKHDMQYTLYVCGVGDESNEEVQHFSFTFYTTVASKNITVQWIVEGVEVEEDIIEYGEEPTYDGVTPTKASNIEYDYAFTEWAKEVDEITGNITYTAMFDSIEHQFTATYNQLSASEITINYENENYYVMSFNTEFDNSVDSRLSYRIILTDEDTNETYQYEGTDPSVDINVPIDVSLLTITYESIGTYDGVEKLFETIKMPDALLISDILVDISDELALVAIDTYELSILINSDMPDEEIYNSVTLLVTYDDSSVEEVKIEDVLVNDTMIATINVPAYCASLTIDYTVDLLGANGHNQRILKGNKDMTLESAYELLIVGADINGYEQSTFEFMYHFVDQETTIAVKDVSTSTITTLVEGSESIVVDLDTSLSENEFTYYLSSNDGEPKENETSVLIPILSVTADYEFNSVNPGDAVVTYNEDGTMNIYLNTMFMTEDPDVWYLVKYRDFISGRVYNIKYTESIAYIEDIPYSNYGLQFYVYKTVDNMDYLLRYTIPSGGVEVLQDDLFETEFIENEDNTIEVSIGFSGYTNIDFDSIVLLVDGSEYAIASTDINFDEAKYQYIFTYTLASMPNEFIIRCDLLFDNGSNYEQISAEREIKGSQNKTMFEVVYREDNYENE